MAKHNDSYGSSYWKLTPAQQRLGMALKIDFNELREIKNQAEKDAGISLHQVRWEKLSILGILEVDMNNPDAVYVRRGENCEKFSSHYGIQSTQYSLEIMDLSNFVKNLFEKNNA